VSQPQISKAACQDLDAIAEYFLTKNIDTGERFFQEFNQKCKHLIKFPLMGRSYVSI
jgi:toxin ParE1/3/4